MVFMTTIKCGATTRAAVRDFHIKDIPSCHIEYGEEVRIPLRQEIEFTNDGHAIRA